MKIKTRVTKTTEHVQTYTVDTNVVVTMDLYWLKTTCVQVSKMELTI